MSSENDTSSCFCGAEGPPCIWVDNSVRSSLLGIAFPPVCALGGTLFCIDKSPWSAAISQTSFGISRCAHVVPTFASCRGRAIEAVLRRQKALVLTVSLGSLRLPTALLADTNNFKKFGKP